MEGYDIEVEEGKGGQGMGWACMSGPPPPPHHHV